MQHINIPPLRNWSKPAKKKAPKKSVKIYNAIVLENWGLVDAPTNNPYTPPELMQFCLNGDATGHPNFKKGSNVTTTPITSIIRDNKANLVYIGVSSGRFYLIGKPHPEYEALFPNATERLIQRLFKDMQ